MAYATVNLWSMPLMVLSSSALPAEDGAVYLTDVPENNILSGNNSSPEGGSLLTFH